MEKVKKSLKTAVIGIGNMGRHHVRNYSEIETSNLVAVADLNKELGQECAKKYNCNYYKNYLEMLETEKPEAVSVAVPSKFHHEVGINVMSKDIHALIEKPIATTIDDANGLIDCAKKYKVKLMIGHIERFNPGVIKLKEIIKDGKLGEITSIVAKRVGVFPPQIKDANVLIDLGVHDIDIINYLLEREPDEVVGNGGRALVDNREDYAEIFLKYGNTTGFVQVNWITPVKIRNLAVTGTKGYAELNYITQKLQLFYSNYSKIIDSFGEFVFKFGEPESVNVEVEQKEPLKAEIESFLNSIIYNVPVKTSAESGLKALEIALDSMKIISYK
jgi:UDP-N-acetylglucosamine 3-dehydrogenase